MTPQEGEVTLNILQGLYKAEYQANGSMWAVTPGIMVHTGTGLVLAPLVLGRSWGFDLGILDRMARHPYEGEKPTVLLFRPTILQANSGLTEGQLAALYAGGTVVVARRVAWDHLVGVLCGSCLWVEEEWGKARNTPRQNQLARTGLIQKIG